MRAAVDLSLVSGALERLLERSGRPIVYDCRATRQRIAFTPAGAAAPDGLLPAFLAAADAVWREATGKSFGIVVEPHSRSAFGYVARGIHAGTFATVMLAMMEAIEAISDNDALVVNDLASLWRQTEDRILSADGTRASS